MTIEDGDAVALADDNRLDRAWFVVDRERARLTAMPSIRGVLEPAIVSILHLPTRQQRLNVNVLGGQQVEIDLCEYTALHEFGLRLRTGEGVTVGKVARLSDEPDEEVHHIVPGAWGVTEDCIVVVRDPLRGRYHLRRSVPLGASTRCVLRFTDGAKLQLSFHRDAGPGEPLGPRLLPPVRLTPWSQRGEPDQKALENGDDLAVATYRDVTMAPTTFYPHGQTGLATKGDIVAYAGESPIVEANEFVLGRQQYLYAPLPRKLDRSLDGPAIYLGLPHNSWGHFLLQGLSRIWYAMRHPELPIIWDARRTPAFAAEVLDVLGIANPQVFLDGPVRVDEVRFPYPGTAIGDFVSPDFASAVGVVEPAPVVVGRKLFVTRSRLRHERGRSEGGARSLDSVAAAYGFEPFAPEEHSLLEQLSALSSAESVLGVEGSALHTVLLLQNRVGTRFWALSRHRGGSGAFQHIKDAKGLSYETLDFTNSRTGLAKSPLDLDINKFEAALDATGGLTQDLEMLEPYVEKPERSQTNLRAHLRNTQVRRPPIEEGLVDVRGALARLDVDTARRLLARRL